MQDFSLPLSISNETHVAAFGGFKSKSKSRVFGSHITIREPTLRMRSTRSYSKFTVIFRLTMTCMLAEKRVSYTVR